MIPSRRFLLAAGNGGCHERQAVVMFNFTHLETIYDDLYINRLHQGQSSDQADTDSLATLERVPNASTTLRFENNDGTI
jgi:hypothetical protein